MGGRGAASGMSDKGKAYGSEYSTVYQSGNIKFVKSNGKSTSTPLETMTKGRVYVTINNQDKIKSVTYYDKNNKKFKQIDIDHPHKVNGKWEQPHKHVGYFHDEKGSYVLSEKEQNIIDRVTKTWYNKINR